MKWKSEQQIWRSRCALNLGKIKFEKKWNLQSPCNLQDFFTSKCRGKLQNTFKKLKTFLRSGPIQASTRSRRVTTGRRLASGKQPVVGDHWSLGCRRPAGWCMERANLPIFFIKSNSLALHYLCKWSTLAGWLQHMPALTRPCPKTSNIHNFWTIAPKIMKFALMRSLFQDAPSQKVSKNLKIVWDHMT
jgi:hypothetical protein